MKSVRAVVAIWLLAYPGYSQDSLVYIKDLQFSSPYEQKAIKTFLQTRKPDFFDLFMATGNLLTEPVIAQHKERLEVYLKEFADEKFMVKKNDKKARHIYEDVHKTFLQKYEYQNRFEEIFYNGRYNCVSASALYGIVFEKTAIPYVIKEKPTHVYLIAYPDAERIMVETTSPVGGVFSISPAFKQNYVRVLKEQKIISAKEYAAEDPDLLFDKYYFGNQENISLLNLVGIQYMNDALYKLEDKNYEGAVQQLEKAYLFYPSDRCGYLLMYSNIQVLESHKAKDLKHAAVISKLSRFHAYGITSEIIQSEFHQVTNELLFVNTNVPALEAYYKYISEAVKDSTISNEITFQYQYERGRFLYNRAHYQEALPYFENALQLKPNNEEINNILIATLAQSLDVESDNLQSIKTLRSYGDKYPSLENNNIFNSMYATALLIQFGREYNFNRATEGDKFKAEFEAHRKKFPDLSINSNLIGQSYSTAAVYFFRKGQTAKAKSILVKGLEYAPGNYELQVRQQMIK
ncbi:MAG TPA: tetratricopeptide repeat protein [Ohtaekwangia sp.]